MHKEKSLQSKNIWNNYNQSSRHFKKLKKQVRLIVKARQEVEYCMDSSNYCDYYFVAIADLFKLF